MTKNILSFPEKPFREWAIIESGIVDAMRAAGHDGEAIRHACDVVKPAFMELWVSNNFVIEAAPVEDSIRRLDIHIHEITKKLLLHLVRLAIENHELRTRLENGGAHHE